jgi:Eco57I restriction-modification methylase
MAAIRNVGELASPYFLVEVWSRRDEIDIDPETFTTLKQKTRRLVRDARAFESRDEEPDDDWRVRRLDLLGLDATDPLAIALNGTGTTLGVRRNDEGLDTVLIGDLPGAPNPDDRPEGADDPPSTAFELALDEYEGEADWGLLLAGLQLRLYRRSSGISQQFVAVNLGDLVEVDDHDTWRAFAGIFRATAFEPDADGVPLVRRVVDESRRHATQLADDMRNDIVAAAESIIQAVLDDPANAEVVGQPTRALLFELFEQTLYVLYRALFVLYAEAHDVLPLSGGEAYATTYSIDHLVERARVEPDHADGDYYGETLARLFALLWEGPEEQARALGIEPVGGELFDPSRTTLLDRCRVADPAWRRALIAIVLGAEGSPRRKLGRRSSFAEIGVDRLGSIYEGLLTLEPYLAPGPRALVLKDGQPRVLEHDKVDDGTRVVRELHEGDFLLESASGRRKGSGSFYTPAEITEYLANAALEPLVAPALEKAQSDPSGAAADILALHVCDPAMGSGAFLVQAARVLGLALARVRAAAGDGRVTPELVNRSKRDVTRHCLYGVDLNPLAVVLAKVSLWLETLERGKPLSFLDAHLRLGDSLIGVSFTSELGRLSTDELARWPKNAHKGLETYLKKETGELGEPVLEQLKKRKGPRAAKQASLPGIGAAAVEEALAKIAASRESIVGGPDESFQLELQHAREFARLEARTDSLRNRLRDVADFWCAQWFSEGEDAPSLDVNPVVPVGIGEFEEILTLLLRGNPIPERLRAHLEAARAAKRRRHFFHWALEFPEVLFERGGFDAVIGNPPWNTLSPDVKEFFSTYDPQTFKRGVPKSRQTVRKEELRQDEEIDSDWRKEARFLHELSHYAKPASVRFEWYAEDGQLRKGDANVFRLFVERAYGILRPGGRLAQVLPDSVYVSSPATGVRQRLLNEGVLERCYVFENRRAIFPIHRSVKVVLLVAQRGGGPTEAFRAAFLSGKDAAGRDRAKTVEEIPATLADLDEHAPLLAVSDLRALAPETWSFPELQTALDAEIAAHCASTLPALNLDERGWQLTYSRGLHAAENYDIMLGAEQLQEYGAVRHGLRWSSVDDEWWPVVEGSLFYHLEFPAEGKEPTKWVSRRALDGFAKWKNSDGRLVFTSDRVAWRDVASATNERSAIACLLPPRTAEMVTAHTVWGGLLDASHSIGLAAVLSSFCFDYLVRFGGKTHLSNAVVNAIPCPRYAVIADVVPVAAEVICHNDEFEALWADICPGRPRPILDPWGVGERRARVDAALALAYDLSHSQYAAVLSTFPNLDRTQPMLPGEPKSFVTRDLALLSYSAQLGQEVADIVELLDDAGVELPPPQAELRRLDARVARYRELGAVPYRPTPRGGRPPTDPELIQAVQELLSDDAQTAIDIAEALEEEERVVKAILEGFVREGDAFADGRGKKRRFYVIEEDQ